jgi:hypothetical protein
LLRMTIIASMRVLLQEGSRVISGAFIQHIESSKTGCQREMKKKQQFRRECPSLYQRIPISCQRPRYLHAKVIPIVVQCCWNVSLPTTALSFLDIFVVGHRVSVVPHTPPIKRQTRLRHFFIESLGRYMKSYCKVGWIVIRAQVIPHRHFDYTHRKRKDKSQIGMNLT